MKKKLLLPALLFTQILWGQDAVILNAPNNVSGDAQQQECEYNPPTQRATSILYETFQNGIPNDWNSYYGFMDSLLIGRSFENGGGYPWQLLNPSSDDIIPGDGLDTRHITIGTLTGTIRNWLVTPYKTVPANSYLSFDASFNNSNGQPQSNDVPDLNGADDKFAIMYQIDTSRWQLLAKWDNQGSEKVLNSIDQFPQTITLPINIPQSSNMRIAFYAESTVANTNNVIHVDNIGIWDCSGSPAPSNIYVTEKSQNSALINWDMPEGTNTCNLQYKKVNSFSAWNTIPSISESSYLLTDLEPETYYRVRLCSNNAQGDGFWSEAIVFRTALNQDNYAIPFSEVFSSFSIPNEWKVYTDPAEYALAFGGYHPKPPKPLTPSTGRWTIVKYNSLEAYHAKAYIYNTSTTWLILPNIELSTASHPENLCLVFDVAKTARNSSAAPSSNLPDDDDEFRVLISTDGGESWLSENCITWKKSGGNHSFNEISNTGTTVRIPLNAYQNGTVMIAFYCGSKTGAFGFDLHIDNIFVGEASHIFIADGNWNVANNWKDNLLPTSPDNSVLLKAAATIPTNYTAHVSSVANIGGSLTIADGGQLIHSNEGVEATIQKSITKYNSNSDGWYLISHPMDTEIQTEDIALLTANSYDLYAFDINEELEWRNFNVSSNNLHALNPNEGYLYATNTNKTLSFNGTLNPASAITLDNLQYNGSARLKGFNLIGNPFACNATIINRSMYVMNDAHDNIIAASNYEIAPNEAVFVAINSEDDPVTITPAYLNQANGNGNGICIEVRKADNTRGQGVLDRARINFSEQDNLEKYTLNANATKLYIPFEGEDFAVLQAQEEGEMPINFKAKNNGNYVLNIYPENSKMEYLHLIDNLTGIDTDLLENPNYSFDANTTDYASRFKLVYSVNGYEDNLDNFAYCSGNTLKINNQGDAMIQVIDVLGHVVSSENINGCYDMDMNFSSGVYILRLVSNNGVKTQKIVIE